MSAELLVQLHDRVAELERRVGVMIRLARVHAVDAAAGTLTARLPSGLELAGIRWAVLSGSVFAPPAVGEQLLLILPGGIDGTIIALAGLGAGAGKGDKYVIGTGTTGLVALAERVLDELNDIRTNHDSHTHPYTDNGAPSTTSVPTAAMGPASSVAASKTEVE